MALITKIEIAKHREISRGLKDDKINPFIDDAEFQDLRPLLGDKFYSDLVANSGETNYTNLLEEFEYTYDDIKYKNPGLKKVLSIYAYSRYILFGSFTDTSFGFIQKSNQDSTPVGDSQKRNIYTQERNTAFNYWLEVEKFINRNKDNYPNWNTAGSCSPRRGRLRISKIT